MSLLLDEKAAYINKWLSGWFIGSGLIPTGSWYFSKCNFMCYLLCAINFSLVQMANKWSEQFGNWTINDTIWSKVPNTASVAHIFFKSTVRENFFQHYYRINAEWCIGLEFCAHFKQYSRCCRGILVNAFERKLKRQREDIVHGTAWKIRV